MKNYTIYIKEPFCSWIDELCEFHNSRNDEKITSDTLITKLVYRGLLETLNDVNENNDL